MDFLSTDGIIMLAAAAAAFFTVYSVWHALVVGNPMGGRIKALRQHQENLKSGLLAPRRNRRASLDTMGVMRRVIRRLNLMRSEQAASTAGLLAQAGWRSKDAVVVFLFFKVCLPFVIGGIVIAVLYITPIFPMPALGKMFVALLSVAVGAYVPEVVVKNATQKRQVKVQRGLPDALDLLVVCAEAGLALDAALTRVARELQKTSPELADELGLTAVELGFLPERRQALENLNKRTNLRAIRGVVNTLLQTEKYGTPLAQSLRVLAAEFRTERMLRAEEKAAKLPATLTIPLILFILPTLFIVLLGPAVLTSMDALGGM